MNIVEEVFCHADPKATALIAGERQLTFGQLEQLTNAASQVLKNVAGKRVGLNCPNGVDHIVWSLAILRSHAVLLPIAPELSLIEREEQMRTTATDIVLCAGGRHWHREAPVRHSLHVDGLQSSEILYGLCTEPSLFDDEVLRRINPALIRFSSGTTGARKGVVLSHETLLERVLASNTHLGLGVGDRVIWVLPMSHHFAVSIILYLRHGVTTILGDSHLGQDIFNLLKEHKGTALYMSPFHYALLASCESAHPVPDLRLAVSTAAALPTETSRRFHERFNIPLRQALGIIECGLPLLNDQWPVNKPTSVGRPQRGYDVSLRCERGEPVPTGHVGELFIRGPGLVDAYLSPWMHREQILQDGWFRTGDMAKQDEEGALFLTGRTHAVINVGGMKCFPEEVETILCSHPSVKEARVSAISHPTFGNVPIAEIVLAEGITESPKPSELMSWCRIRLSSYKLPVKISFVSAIPKTASGKIKR